MQPVPGLVPAAADSWQTRGFPRPQRVLHLSACQQERAQSLLQFLAAACDGGAGQKSASSDKPTSDKTVAAWTLPLLSLVLTL